MKKKFSNRIRIAYIYMAFVILFSVVAGIVLMQSYRAEQGVEDMQKITSEYFDGQSAINDLMAASDYLTKQARAFVVTGDVESGNNYKTEIEVTMRRENALETINEIGMKKDAQEALEDALQKSQELTEMEYHAMLLAAEGFGIDESMYKDFTGNAKFTSEEKELSAEQKKKKAIELMFGEEYDEKKDRIREDVNGSLQELMTELEERQLRSYDAAVRLSRNELTLLIIMLIGIIAMIILTAVLMIGPIIKSTAHIAKREPMPLAGSAEFYALAESYNTMLLLSRKHQEKLSYDATHDELTGLFNRKMFDEKKESYGDENIAMLILDVDHFKEVNDTYGHEAGDKVLRKVANALSSSFRLEDCVCRIGGDEFAVIMRQMDPSLKHVICDKINNMRELLKTPDDLPHATLSIGIAFSADKGPEKNLFKKADKALYSVKEHGRDGFAFYNDMKYVPED